MKAKSMTRRSAMKSNRPTQRGVVYSKILGFKAMDSKELSPINRRRNPKGKELSEDDREITRAF